MSVLVDASLPSTFMVPVATLAAISASTVPLPVIPETATLNVGAKLPEGKDPFPALINCSFGDNTDFFDKLLNDNGWARISYNVNMVASERDHGGVVETLFSYKDYKTNLDAPSVLMAYAWGVGIIIDVIESGAFENKIDAKLRKTKIENNTDVIKPIGSIFCVKDKIIPIETEQRIITEKPCSLGK